MSVQDLHGDLIGSLTPENNYGLNLLKVFNVHGYIHKNPLLLGNNDRANL